MNPWEEINLDIYENHMSSNEVYQLQTLKRIMDEQAVENEHKKIAILGIAGGNGLDCPNIKNAEKVYGIDINSEYLSECVKRYKDVYGERLELIQRDLTLKGAEIPCTDLLICNLIVEYLGIDVFSDLVYANKEHLKVVSCVTQKNNKEGFVSSSSLTSAFDPIMKIHNDIEIDKLSENMKYKGFEIIKKVNYDLPNGKEFIRVDYSKSEKEC